jgi:putative aldouronate transport system permease protein
MAGTLLAFKDFNATLGFFKSPWVGFKNFEFIFRSGDAFRISRNTILYNISFIVLGTLVALAIAIALSELRGRRMARVHQTVVILPYFLSWTVVSYFVYAFISEDKGVLNAILKSVFHAEPVSWYMEPKYWPFFFVILAIWKSVGYSSIYYLSSIMSIDSQYYDAALIDGAGKWQQITKITLPHLMPIITILFLISVGSIFNSDFGLFYIIPRQNGILYSVTQTIDVYVYTSLTKTGDIGMAAAAGLFQSVVGFICVMSANMTIRKTFPDYALF